jgi:hypothetical protein
MLRLRRMAFGPSRALPCTRQGRTPLDLSHLRDFGSGENWLAKFGHGYKWNTLPERGTFGVDQE